MFKRLFALALACAVFLPLAALAQATAPAAPSDNPFTVKALIDLLSPAINTLILAVIGSVFTWGASKILAFMRVKDQDAAVLRIQEAFKSYAGIILAHAEDNLANRTFHTASPEVAQMVQTAQTFMVPTVIRSKLDEPALRRLALGAVGNIQAVGTTVVIEPPKDAPAIIKSDSLLATAPKGSL
jgi:hypothetical protein